MSLLPIDVESMLGPFGDPQARRLAEEVIALRKQAALDRQSREASQTEFARLNRELNDVREALAHRDSDVASARREAASLRAELTKCYQELNATWETSKKVADERAEFLDALDEQHGRIGVLLDEIASTAIAAGMMDPARRGSLDGPNAIQFLRLMTEQYEAMR